MAKRKYRRIRQENPFRDLNKLVIGAATTGIVLGIGLTAYERFRNL
jgi:hypothetical protein